MTKPGSPMSTRVRRRRIVGAVLAAASVVLISPSPARSETTLNNFKASASAEGGRVRFTIPERQIVEDVFDGGGAVAVSALDPYAATSYAALPWPGELAIIGPSLLQAVTGQKLPGSYPFYVSASNPTTPEQGLSDPSGTYRLLATAGDGEAAGSAEFGKTGDGGGGTKAVSSTVARGNKVVAVAETLNQALSFGDGALKIASVRSQSETSFVEGDKEPASKTELVIEGGSAGGMNFAFGPNGFVVAKNGTPVPAASGLAALNTALAPSGISIRIVSGTTGAGGGVADAFEIAFRQGASGREFTGMVITVRFGGASSSIKVAQ